MKGDMHSQKHKFNENETENKKDLIKK